jgi:hypothetical protein
MVEMEDNVNEEADPPPDMPSVMEALLLDDPEPVQDNGGYGRGFNEWLHLDYMSMVLPNEDDDPEYWNTAMECYRSGALAVYFAALKKS